MDLIFALFATATAVIWITTVVVPWYYHRSSPLPPAVSHGRAVIDTLHRPQVSWILALTGVVHIPLLFAATVLSATRNAPQVLTALCAFTAALATVLTWFRWSLARCQPAALRDTFTVAAYVGGSNYGFDTMEHATEVTTVDGAPLLLVFTTSTAASADDAAWMAYEVSSCGGRDDAGQSRPTGTRTLGVGDVLSVTTPQGAVTRFPIEPTGIFPFSTS